MNSGAPGFELASLLRAILDKVNLATYVKDASGRYLFVNRQYEHLAGVSREFIVGKVDSELFPPEVARLFREQDLQVLAQGALQEFEETIPLPGGVVSFITAKFPLMDSEGAVYAVGGMCTDITTRKQVSEENLASERERLAVTLRSIGEGVASSDTSGRVSMLNAIAERLSGWTAEAAQGLPLDEVLRFEGPAGAGLLPLHALLERGRAHESTTEAVLVARDGGRRLVTANAAPICDRTGGVIGAVVTFRDITAQREALRASEEKYRQLFESSRDALMTLAPPTWQFTAANAATLAMFRAASGPQFLAIEPWRVSPPLQPDGLASSDKARGMIEVAMATGSHFFDWTHRRLDGEDFPATVLLTRMDLGGQVVLHATVRDVTEQKRSEEERSELQNQLFQSQKMEAIGTLAGGLAHDFNNLLSTVLGNLSILEVSLLDRSGLQRLVKDAMSAVKRSADLTQQMLGFARGGRYDAKPLDLHLLVTRISEMFGRTRKDIVIRVERSPSLCLVLADSTQVEQVLLNLLLNAGDAMPGGGELVIRTEQVEAVAMPEWGTAAGRFARVSVADAGVGMDAGIQARVFEPFFTTKARGRGTGLGLASVYGIVKRHGGFVTLQSEKAVGSTFAVHLPATELPAPPPKPSSPGPLPGAETILVVDDEGEVLQVTSLLLEHLGYRVLTAASGREAIELFRAHRQELSLVLLDLIMPVMSGAQTFEALRELAPEVKILLASGYTVEGEAAELLKRGADGFIGKPFDLVALSAKLRAIL